MSAATAVPLRPIARGSVLKLWLGLGALALAAVALAWFGTGAMQRETTASGLQFQAIEEGEGPQITPADMVALHYELSVNGEVVQSTRQTGQPFITGTEGLFPGFSEGLQMMRPGGRYRIWVPPHLGIQGEIPPNAPFDSDDTLVFDVEILEVAVGAAAMQRMFGLPEGAGQQAPPEGEEAVPTPPPAEEAGGNGSGGAR